jgi:uncharacterized protein (DUF2384 family)
MKGGIMPIQHSPKPSADLVLTKAILNMAKFYRLNGKDLSELLGISESGISRLHLGTKLIISQHKEGEIALLLLRIYRSLNTIVGQDHDKAIAWLNHDNLSFTNQKPIECMKTITGLVNVLQYLDAIRGKL